MVGRRCERGDTRHDYSRECETAVTWIDSERDACWHGLPCATLSRVDSVRARGFCDLRSLTRCQLFPPSQVHVKRMAFRPGAHSRSAMVGNHNAAQRVAAKASSLNGGWLASSVRKVSIIAENAQVRPPSHTVPKASPRKRDRRERGARAQPSLEVGLYMMVVRNCGSSQHIPRRRCKGNR